MKLRFLCDEGGLLHREVRMQQSVGGFPQTSDVHEAEPAGVTADVAGECDL